MIVLVVLVAVFLLPALGGWCLWAGLRNGDRTGDLRVEFRGPAIRLENPSRRPVIVTVEATQAGPFGALLFGGSRTEMGRPSGEFRGDLCVVEAGATVAVTLPYRTVSRTGGRVLVTVRPHQEVGRRRVHRRLVAAGPGHRSDG
jgi:hypothetical protein